VSRVGGSDDSTKAIVYLEKSSGPKSGFGEAIILDNASGDWVISRIIDLWLS